MTACKLNFSIRTEKYTTLDIAKIQLFDKLREVYLSVQTIQPTTTSNATITSSYTTRKPLNRLNGAKIMTYFSTQGWALKVPEPRRPIDEFIKSFIRSILNEEKLYSVKFSAKDFVRRIRTARHNDSTKMFSPNQYLTSSQVETQIKLFSKQLSGYHAKGHKNIVQSGYVDEDEDENQYNKTPRLSRKQTSIRTSTRKPS